MKHFTKPIVIAAGIVALVIGSYIAYQHYFAAHNEVKIQSIPDGNQLNIDSFKALHDKAKAKFDSFKNQDGGQGGLFGNGASTPPTA